MNSDTRQDEAPDGGADGVYDTWSSRYGVDDPRASGYVSPFWFRQERRLILDLVGPRPGRVLDVACGFGLVTLPLAARACEVFGVDYNALACRGAARNGLRAVRGNAFALPFPDDTFETITCVEFLQQCEREQVAALLGDLARVAAPGARLILVWRNHRAPLHRLALRISDALGRPRVPLNEHPFENVAEMAQRAGLGIDKAGAIFPPFRQLFQNRRGIAARALGTGFLAVLRKPGEIS